MKTGKNLIYKSIVCQECVIENTISKPIFKCCFDCKHKLFEQNNNCYCGIDNHYINIIELSNTAKCKSSISFGRVSKL